MNRQLFNPSVIKHNHFDAHIATAKHCGTHWVKYMLSLVLAEIHNLPKPEHIRDDSIIGHPKNPPIHENIPQIALTHSHPHYLMRLPAVYGPLHVPKCAFIIRDPKDMLVSIYKKSEGAHIVEKYGQSEVSFSEYLRTPIDAKVRLENIWGILRFFNAWGAAQKANPKNNKAFKYEDLIKDTHSTLKTLCDHIGVQGVSDEILQTAIDQSSKENMRKKLDTSEDQYERSVNLKRENTDDWFCPEDHAYFKTICDRYLKFDFGYLK